MDSVHLTRIMSRKDYKYGELQNKCFVKVKNTHLSFFRQKRTQEAAAETPRPKPAKRPRPEPARDDDAPKKKKKINTEQEENPSKENQPPKTKKGKKKKKTAPVNEDDSGAVSEQSAELPEVYSTPLSKEGKKKKKNRMKAGKEEEAAPITVSPDVPAKKKSERLYDCQRYS